MPSQYATLSALRFKRNWQIIPQKEVEQLFALSKVYGNNLTLSAIRFAKSSELIEIAKLLVQMGGFRSGIPACLKNILMDDDQANQRYSPEQMEISNRLAKVTRPSDEDDLKAALLNTCQNDATREILRSRLINLTELRQRALFAAVRKYGPALVVQALLILDAFSKFDETTSIEKFKAWLGAAANQAWQKLDEMDGLSGSRENIPPACPYRISRYYWAKTGQDGEEGAVRKLGYLAKEFDLDFMIYIMSTIPGSMINPESIRLKCTEIADQFAANESTRKIKTRIELYGEEKS